MATMMKNTFTGLVPSFPNKGIHVLIAETMTFRKQLMLRNEFKSQSGWNDATNLLMKDWLERLAKTCKRITYSPANSDPAAILKQRLEEARDTSKTLADAYDGKSVNSDDIVMPSGHQDGNLPYDFTGNHDDFPQPTLDRIENDFARMFVVGLDRFVVAATNCDSRTQPSTINAYESAQLQAMLNELYAICMEKGGEANRVTTPTGLMESDRKNTFNYDGQYDVLPDADNPSTN